MNVETNDYHKIEIVTWNPKIVYRQGYLISYNWVYPRTPQKQKQKTNSTKKCKYKYLMDVIPKPLSII